MKQYTYLIYKYILNINHISHKKLNSNYHAFYKLRDRFRTNMYTCNENETLYKINLYQHISFQFFF